MTKQAAEKGLFPNNKPDKHTSGAKALIDLIGFMPGINPRHKARMSFSADCKVVPLRFLQLLVIFSATCKDVPCQSNSSYT
jgi:hypothetical protein